MRLHSTNTAPAGWRSSVQPAPAHATAAPCSTHARTPAALRPANAHSSNLSSLKKKDFTDFPGGKRVNGGVDEWREGPREPQRPTPAGQGARLGGSPQDPDTLTWAEGTPHGLSHPGAQPYCHGQQRPSLRRRPSGPHAHPTPSSSPAASSVAAPALSRPPLRPPCSSGGEAVSQGHRAEDRARFVPALCSSPSLGRRPCGDAKAWRESSVCRMASHGPR